MAEIVRAPAGPTRKAVAQKPENVKSSSEAGGSAEQGPFSSKCGTPRTLKAVIDEPGSRAREMAFRPRGNVESVADACVRSRDGAIADRTESNGSGRRRHQRGAGPRQRKMLRKGVGPSIEAIHEGMGLDNSRWRTPELVSNGCTSGNPASSRDEAPRGPGDLIENAETSQDGGREPPRRTKPEGFGEAGARLSLERGVHESDMSGVGREGSDVRRPEESAHANGTAAADKSP